MWGFIKEDQQPLHAQMVGKEDHTRGITESRIMKEDKTREVSLETVKHCRGKEGGVGLMKRVGDCD